MTKMKRRSFLKSAAAVSAFTILNRELLLVQKLTQQYVWVLLVVEEEAQG